MEREVSKILARLDFHQKVRKVLTITSYFLIVSGVLTFIFHAVSKKNQKYKLVSDYKKDPKKYQTEKIMVNPKIRFQYNDDQIYEIQAKRALHKNNEEVTLFDVYAEGEIGDITSGQLEIDESGNHLVFSQNPILILNEQE